MDRTLKTRTVPGNGDVWSCYASMPFVICVYSMWESVRQTRKTHIELCDGTVCLNNFDVYFIYLHLHLAGFHVHIMNIHRLIIHRMFTNIISLRQFASNLWYCANVVLTSSLAQSSCSISFSSLSLGMSSTIRPCISLVME